MQKKQNMKKKEPSTQHMKVKEKTKKRIIIMKI